LLEHQSSRGQKHRSICSRDREILAIPVEDLASGAATKHLNRTPEDELLLSADHLDAGPWRELDDIAVVQLRAGGQPLHLSGE